MKRDWLNVLSISISRPWGSEPARRRLRERKALTGCSEAEDRRASAQRRPTVWHFQTAKGISRLCIQDTLEVSSLFFLTNTFSSTTSRECIYQGQAFYTKKPRCERLTLAELWRNSSIFIPIFPASLKIGIFRIYNFETIYNRKIFCLVFLNKKKSIHNE